MTDHPCRETRFGDVRAACHPLDVSALIDALMRCDVASAPGAYAYAMEHVVRGGALDIFVANLFLAREAARVAECSGSDRPSYRFCREIRFENLSTDWRPGGTGYARAQIVCLATPDEGAE